MRDSNPAVAELFAGDDGLDEGGKAIAVGGERLLHTFQHLFVRQDERAAQGKGEQLAAEVVDELSLAILLNIS